MSPSHRGPRPLTQKETQGALDALVQHADQDGLSPAYANGASANWVVREALGVDLHRASYVLDQLTKSGAIERIPSSRRVRVLRVQVSPAAPRASSQSALEKYTLALNKSKATIAGLRATIKRLKRQNAQLRAENDVLRRRLEEAGSGLTQTDTAEVAFNAAVASIFGDGSD